MPCWRTCARTCRPCWGRPVDTLFIGGGTPSLFSAAGIGRLMAGIRQSVDLAQDLESTLEANPGSAEADRFAGFRAAGINRLSLGIQSFADSQLQALGRVHDSDQARAAIDLARRAGFDNFNLDLMHGLPGQTAAAAGADLSAALSFDPPHLSWYQLTIEPNTVFHSRPPTLPVEDCLAEIQDRGELALTGAGYEQYEVSAYSRAGFQCRHNRNYWEFGDYLGIGAGAHGKLTGADGRIRRSAKTRQPADYLQRGGIGCGRWRELDPGEVRGEYLMNALRLAGGFRLQAFSDRTGLPEEALQPELERALERGLLRREGGRISATPLGMRFLDSVVAQFLPG